jgi:hypothetical protein
MYMLLLLLLLLLLANKASTRLMYAFHQLHDQTPQHQQQQLCATSPQTTYLLPNTSLYSHIELAIP